MMLYNLQAKLGIVPDFMGTHEANANTSLVYHAGDHTFDSGGDAVAVRFWVRDSCPGQPKSQFDP